MQGRATLGAFLWDGGTYLSLEEEVHITRTFMDLLDHPPQRLLVERLATLADVIHRCFARSDIA